MTLRFGLACVGFLGACSLVFVGCGDDDGDSDIDLQTAEPEFRRWRWAAPDEVLALIVPFKRAVYEAVFEELGPPLGLTSAAQAG